MRLKTSATTRHRCPLCREQIDHLSNVSCQGCATLHHRACWEEFTGCATLGCKSPKFSVEHQVRERVPARLRRCAGLPAAGVRRAYRWLLEKSGAEGDVERMLCLGLVALGSLVFLLFLCGSLVLEVGCEGVLGVLLAGGLMVGSHVLAHRLLAKFNPPRK